MANITLKLREVSNRIFAGIAPVDKWSMEVRQPVVSYINLKDLKDGGVSVSKLDLVRVANPDISRYQIKKGDILIACRGAQPKIGVVQKALKEFTVTSPNIITVRLNEKLNPILLRFYLESSAGNKQLLSKAVISKAQYILTISALVELEVPVPPLEIQKQLIQLLSLMEEQYKFASQATNLRKQIMQNLAFNLMTYDQQHRRLDEQTK